MGDIGVDTAVELHLRCGRRVHEVVVRQVGYSIQAPSDARDVGIATVAQVLQAQAGLQRRAYIQATRYGVAVHSLLQPDGCASPLNDTGRRHTASRKRQVLCRNAARRRRGSKLRSRIPTLRRTRGRKRAGLPVEEGKYFVFPKRSAQTAAVLVKSVLITVQATLCWRSRVSGTDAVPTLVGIQS